MMDGRHRNRSGLYFAVRSKKLLDRTKAAATELLGHSVSTRRIGVNHADQPQRRALFRQPLKHPCVIASEDAHSDDGYVDDAVSCQAKALEGHLII